MNQEREYILGTHSDEICRLGLQHRVWRPRMLDAWRRAGFTIGQTLLDVGCGPGYASADMAEIVGEGGRVLALDRSSRFLEAARTMWHQRGLSNISAIEIDLDEGDLPSVNADGAWCRWVFAFVKRPRALLERLGCAVRRGGVLVVHEYFDYSTWRVSPRNREFEDFVDTVMASWRVAGGEPDIGLELPLWLEDAGFYLNSVKPFIDVLHPQEYPWHWPRAFLDVNLSRLERLGFLDGERARAMKEAFAASEADPHAMMVTPAVLEIIAIRL